MLTLPRQEHRKRDKKSKNRCSFLSHATVVPSVKAPPRSRSRKPKESSNVKQSTESKSSIPLEDPPQVMISGTVKRKGTTSNKEEQALRRSTRLTSATQVPRAQDTTMNLTQQEKIRTPSPPPAPAIPGTPHQTPISSHPSQPDEPTMTSTVIPPLSTTPLNRIVSVTENELDMTVEEWIRHEMGLQYGNFKADGERMINLFKEKTIEVRRIIHAL